jgi:hypothetical protein
VLADGLLSLFYARAHRGARVPGWGWLLAGGLTNIALGTLMLRSLLAADGPTPAMLVLPGAALGCGGLGLILMGRATRRARGLAAAGSL